MVAQNDGTNTRYLEYDGLGSVRQLIGPSASVLLAQTFDPYGNGFSKAGTATTSLGFTGEQTDSNGFVFLRARYYNPAIGRFFEADPSRKEQNAYQYSYSNPINYTDPSGLFPTEEDVNKGDAEYSCNCGWLDWKHIFKSDDLSFSLVANLGYAASNFHLDPALNDKWGIHFGIPLGLGPLEFELFSGTAVIPNDQLSTNQTALAVSIFMDANEHFEELQGEWGQKWWLPFHEKLQSSYYSEEDLTSDLIGLYIGSQRFYSFKSSEELREEVKRKCRAVGMANSLTVFRQTYANGQNAITDWRNWYPRFVGCPSGICTSTPEFPSEFSSLTSLRISPKVNGAWWWYNEETGWGLVPTKQAGVFRFQDTRVPTPTPTP